LRIGLLSAAFPPDKDGIGDYTFRLASQLSDGGHKVTVLTSIGPTRLACRDVDVIPFFDPVHPASIGALAERVPKDAALEWLVLQYNPFGFGPRGFCPNLPVALYKLKKQRPETKVAIMCHETYYTPWYPLKQGIMRLWQCPILAALARVADKLMASTERWVRQVELFSFGKPARFVPVGSNLPDSSKAPNVVRDELGLGQKFIVGLFGSAHISRNVDWVAAATRRINTSRSGEVAVFYIGGDSRLIAPQFEGIQFVDFGFLESEIAAARIKAMDALLCPFADGISARRGSAICGLQQGISVVSNVGPSTDQIFKDWNRKGVCLSEGGVEGFVATCEEIAANSQLRSTVSSGARAFYEKTFSWPKIASTYLEVLSG
jgi:glycosyltransferase involved in cell wall biosynthesis